MTKGSPYGLLIRFSIPLFFGNLFQQLYTMIDSIIVGRFVGVEALAAVGVTGGYVFLINGFGQGLSTGFSIPISQRYGAKDLKGVKKNYAMGLLLSAILSIFVSLLSILLTSWLLKMIDTPSNIFDMAYIYLVIIFAGLPSVIYYNYLSGVLRAVGDSKSPLIFLLISSILNIILDLVFVIIIPLGCAGVAIATLLSQTVSALIAYIYIYKRYPMFKLSRDDWKIDLFIVKNLLRIGVPGGIQFSVCAIGTIIVQAAINAFGSDYVAAISVGIKIESMVNIPFTVLGMALATYAGQNLGAGDIKRIKQGFKDVTLMCVIISIVSLLLTRVLTEPIVGLFLERDESFPLILEITQYYINTVSYFFLPLGSILIFRTAAQGLGSGLIPMLSSLVELAMRALGIIFLPSLIGFLGVILSGVMAWVAAGILCPVGCIILIRKIERRFKAHEEITA